MRFMRFEHQGRAAIGIRLGSEIVDLSAADPAAPADLIGLIAGGAEALQRAKTAVSKGRVRHAVDSVRYLMPITNADKNIGLGLNYLKHWHEMTPPNTPLPAFPGMFMRVQSSMVAHRQPIVRPLISDTLDYEGELAVIIGRRGHHIPVEDAHSYVFGYTCHNDGSVREYNQWAHSITAGKNFNETGGLGPEIVTADELPPGAAGLSLRTRVNGEVRQEENTGNMHWNVATLIHLMSKMMILLPGDILATGTPPGVGAGFKPPKYLRAGDTVEVEIEGIGTLINPIVDESTQRL